MIYYHTVLVLFRDTQALHNSYMTIFFRRFDLFFIALYSFPDKLQIYVQFPQQSVGTAKTWACCSELSSELAISCDLTKVKPNLS